MAEPKKIVPAVHIPETVVDAAPPAALEPVVDAAPPAALEPVVDAAPPAALEPVVDAAPPAALEPVVDAAPPAAPRKLRSVYSAEMVDPFTGVTYAHGGTDEVSGNWVDCQLAAGKLAVVD